MEGRRALSESEESVSESLTGSAQSSEDRMVDEISRKMLSWSELWFGSSENSQPEDEQRRVKEQLLYWIKLCIGLEASAVLTSDVEDISLATSTPLLTALLGRRAMVELSRRVLNDS